MAKHKKTINVMHHINGKIAKKNHIISSIDAEKELGKIRNVCIIKTQKKLGVEGKLFNILMVII